MKKEEIIYGIRTNNLYISNWTPYPLGHLDLMDATLKIQQPEILDRKLKSFL